MKEKYLTHNGTCKDSIYISPSTDKSNIIYVNEWVSYKVEPISNDISFSENDFGKRGTYGMKDLEQ